MSKKQIILEAAAILFREKGYAATSMRDLAETVQLKASSLYNHISGKEEILLAICFENANRFLNEMEEVEREEIKATEKIKKLLSLHIRLAMKEVTSITAFNDEWRHLSEPHLSQFKQIRKEYENRFITIIKAGINNGEIIKTNPTILLHTIFSASRWLYDWYKPDGKLKPSEIEADIISLLMKGFSIK